jgi:hypothetical protein
VGEERSWAAAVFVTIQIRRDSLATHAITSFETDIVVDLGCCSYTSGNRLEDSIDTLIKRFKPAVLFGFDPHPGLRDTVGQVYGTTVITSRRAAWICDGDIGLALQGNCTHVVPTRPWGNGLEATTAFDIAAWVRALPNVKIVLKIDVEGAEYMVLPHLIGAGLMSRFSRILIEWHEGKYANGYESDKEAILAEVECTVEEWQ